jgi:hypothetical protein
MPCFEDELLEVLVHPLRAALDVGEGNADSLINGHAIWTTRSETRRQNIGYVTQAINEAEASALAPNVRPIVLEPSLAHRHHAVRARFESLIGLASALF